MERRSTACVGPRKQLASLPKGSHGIMWLGGVMVGCGGTRGRSSCVEARVRRCMAPRGATPALHSPSLRARWIRCPPWTPGPAGLLAPSSRSILRIHGTTRPPTTRLPPVADCAEPRPTAPRPPPLSHHCCSRPSHSLACLTANSLPVFRVPEETPGCARKHSTHPSLPQARVLHNTPLRSSARSPDFIRDRSLFPLPDRHPPKRHPPSDSRLPIFTSTYPSHAAISAHPLVHLRHPIATALDAFAFAFASARRASVCTSMSAAQV